MSYQVLARKWRPGNFEELVGQEHVSRVLINGLDNNRLHHAFLFTGTRGVGKTTIARILSRSLNCATGVTSRPCGQCPACQEISEGRFVDLIEVDAASRTKVEDTRELLENVQYRPTRGRYKIYLIDEVHMLSNHSFNALLKTLEEPPPHVKFLLATTDPQKVLVTILSRCLQFNLRRLSAHEIAAHLAHILAQENIEQDESALRRIARSAEGSMRDALSLLDQAIAFGGGRVGDEDVRNMLGTIESSHVYELIRYIHQQDATAVMQVVQRLDERSPDYIDVLGEMISVLHHIAMEQQVAGCMTDEWDDPERIQALAGTISPQDVQLYYQIALQGREDLKLNPVPREGFDVVLMRMIAFRPWSEDDATAARAAPLQAAVAPAMGQPVRGDTLAQSAAVSGAATRVQQESPIREGPPVESDVALPPSSTVPAPEADQSVAGEQGTAPSGLPDWQEILDKINLKAMPQQLAANCQLATIEDDRVYLILDQAHARMLSDGPMKKIEDALGGFFGKPIRLKIQPGVPSETPAQRQLRQDEERRSRAIESIERDENVQQIKEVFGATVSKDDIQPIGD